MQELYKYFRSTTGVCTDTRSIQENSFFIALSGDNFNGNEYVEQAIEKGAKYAITSDQEKVSEHIYYVPDTLLFLQKLANYHRNQFDIPVIGITGSNGKTTTKELVRDVLATEFNVLATNGNLNNHIGVPLTLLKLDSSHQIAIIEMGANKPGDIKELVEIAEPNLGVISNIGKAHLEGFGDYNGVYNTKKELFDFVSSQKYPFFLNADYPEFKELFDYKNLTKYGTQNADVIGKLNGLTPFVDFTWKYKNEEHQVRTNIIGEYNFYNLICAVTFGLHFNISPDHINKALETFTPDNNRSQIVETKRNTLILDAYNANPSSVTSALTSFNKMEHDNKWVILGDMLELGNESIHEHQEIVNLVKKLGFQSIFVGHEFAQVISNEQHYKNSDELEMDCKNISKALVLIKGSRGIKLERIEKYL